MAYFDQSKASIIQSDASKKGLGAVLLQDNKPVIYASRALTETERRYSNIEQELLSVVFCFEISSLYLWIHSDRANRPQAIGQLVEEVYSV